MRLLVYLSFFALAMSDSTTTISSGKEDTTGKESESSSTDPGRDPVPITDRNHETGTSDINSVHHESEQDGTDVRNSESVIDRDERVKEAVVDNPFEMQLRTLRGKEEDLKRGNNKVENPEKGSMDIVSSHGGSKDQEQELLQVHEGQLSEVAAGGVDVTYEEDTTAVDSPAFLTEDQEPAYEAYTEAIDLIFRLQPGDHARGYALLKEAADNGNKRALEMLALAYIFGSYLERNFTRAYEMFADLANGGHPIGQLGLGFMYSTGIGMNSSQAKAVVHYVFAALGGHQFAQMVMGHRSHMGVGVVKSCEASLVYYHKSAAKVIKSTSLVSGGILVSKVRLMDEDDEVPSIYGVTDDEIVHYQSIFSDSDNTGAQFMLGLYYMFGVAGAQRSFLIALKFLKQASKDGLPAAYTLMGKIYAEGGNDVPQDYSLAYSNFKLAADQRHGDGYSGLGMLYLNGLGVRKDKRVALEMFQKAADRGSSDGQYYLGKMYYEGDGVYRDINKGIKFFQLASHGGHLHAIYILGEIHAEGTGTKRNCNFAVELFKTVAERSKITRMFTEAHRLYVDGDIEASFLMYLFLAELGFEVAQSNVAYLLEQGDLSFIHADEQMMRGLLYWNRAAAQGYTQARVKLGDYYYYGLGTESSYANAAAQYRMASDKLSSPQAMFNLAYMYEHGQGLEKDYHLAKRYYDMAAETSSEAAIPVNLALLKLNMMNMLRQYDWLDFLSAFGEQWDLYLVSILACCIGIVVAWRTRR